MEKRCIITKRGTVYYWTNENQRKKSIMFTHGVTGDHTLFQKQIEYWSKEYHVIIWDMPLHGESRPYKDFSFANAAEDMKAILDQEGIEHSIMAAHSAGGYAAQAFAQKYPHSVEAFIGIDTTPFGSKYYKKSELFWTNHYSDIAKWYPYNLYCKLAAKAVSFTKESYLTLYDCLVRLGKQGMLVSADAVYKDFPNYQEVDFKCPVLLLLGENDKLGYIKKYNLMWTKETGYPLIIIPNASHNSHYDNYEEVNRVIYEFLQRTSNYSG